jgi:alpha-glucosidase (family GH31 glycosyl hydrolase)
VAASSRMALTLRYRLLPHLYTLMFNAHRFGDTVHNAMWMHFPHDMHAHSRDHQYMWAGSILFTPVVEEDAVSVEVGSHSLFLLFSTSI